MPIGQLERAALAGRGELHPQSLLGRQVYWTALGDDKERQVTAKALNRTIPYLRPLLSQRLMLRRVPELKFQYDESIAAADRIEQIIQELHTEREAHPELNALVDSPVPPKATDDPRK